MEPSERRLELPLVRNFFRMAKRATVRMPHRRPAPTKLVLSRGQKKRQAKKENMEWKKKALEARNRAKQVKQHGQALGTITDLLVDLKECDESKNTLFSTATPIPTQQTRGRPQKMSVRQAEKETEKKRFEAIVNFAAFQADPLGTIRQHLEIKASQSVPPQMPNNGSAPNPNTT